MVNFIAVSGSIYILFNVFTIKEIFQGIWFRVFNNSKKKNGSSRRYGLILSHFQN